MRALWRFLTSMDARAARAVGVSLALFALVAAIFLLGRFGGGGLFEPGALGAWFERNAAPWWLGLPATVLIFTLLAFVGVPQFALIAATVLAFGPLNGFFFAWTATMVSATVNFWIGRFAGADVVKRYGGQTVNRISDFVGRNGFWASLIVRIVPSAPFIVVNMAAGVSRMSYFAFIAGAAIGVIPKTALVAIAGQGFMELLSEGDWRAAAGLFALVLVWIAAMLLARRWLRKGGQGSVVEPTAQRSEPLAIEDAPAHKEASRSSR